VATTPLAKAQILRPLKDFLKEKSPPPKPHSCPHCGSPMQLLGARFLLSGTTLNRNVSLPGCPVCEREVLETLPRPETIH